MNKKLIEVLSIGVLFGIIIYNNDMKRVDHEYSQIESTPITIIKNHISEIEKERQMELYIENKKQEIANYLGSDEYVKREKIKELELQTGLDIKDYKKVDMKCSYYTSLAVENGGYEGLTYKGENLEFGMVANNRYPLNTKILVGDTLKTVKDIGAESHFGNYERLDVFVPRNPGESDSEYLKRVNNYGKNTVESYVLELEEN